MSSRPFRRGFVACYIAAVFLLSTGVVFATESNEVQASSPWCKMAGWLVQPFGFCQPQAQTSIVPESGPTALTYADLSQLLPPTPEVAGASTSILYETNYVTLSSAGVSQSELTSRIHKLILYINLRDELTKYSRVSEDIYPSKTASRNPADLVTKGYLWESLDRVNDRISDNDGGGGTTNNITNNYSTTTNATGDLAADTLALGTTTSLAQLTLTEDIFLDSFIPGATTNRLYNSGGVLYWNGTSITGSSTGNNWAESGSDVYRISGNVGIGSSTPSSKLTVIGNGYFAGNITGTGALTIAGLASLQNASTSNLSIIGRLYDSTNTAGALGMILQTTGTTTHWVATSSLGFAAGASTYLALTDTINSYTANRIQFTNASGTALTDSANLVFTGSRLGIGTTTPGNTLTVAGDIGATAIKAEVYDMGGHVCNVEAYGAVGDNSTINDAAIAAAIADCAPDGGTVLFPMGQFRISTPIVLDAPVTLMGTYAPRWSYASTPRSSIRADFGTFVGSAVIHVRDQSISGAPSANNGGRLINLTVDGGSYGSNIHGLYFEGLVRDWKVVDVDVSQTSGDGFLAEVGSGSGNPRGFTIKGLSIYSAASHGFRATALNDSYLEDIVAVGNALRGFYLSSMGETKIVGSRAVFNALEGLYIDGASSNGGLQFTDFSTDRNDRHGVRISATGTTTITFNGLLTRRDGPNDGGGTETPYAGLAVIGSSTAQVAPVIVTNLSQIIGVDDDGTGTKAPLVGVRVTNAAYVRVNGQLWGTTNAFVDGGGNGHFVIDEESIIKSGNEWTGITPVLYNNKWVATTTGLLYASGTVTIGSTPTTTRLLNIIASNNPGARFTDTTNNVMLDMRAEDSQAFIGTFTNHQLRFQTNNTSRLTIDTNGRVGIGTTSPATELAVVGSAYFTGALRDSSNTAGTLGMVLQTTGSGTQWVATSSLGFAAGASTYLALTDTPSSFSANRIPFTNASATALTDSSNFTFDGSNLGLGGQQGIAFGGTRYLYASSTNDSITFGENAGSALLGDGLDNILIGLESGHLLTTADYNVALGTYSLRNATSSSRNIAIGEQALEALTGGDNNVAIGYKVGESLTSGVHNVGVGNFALFSAVSGSFNTGVGHSALSELIDGTYNSAFGENAGEHLATGTLNVLAGYGAAQDATNTSNSVIIGAQAAQGLGASVLTWQNNTIIGYRAGRAINGSSNNTIIGYRAADSLTTGANNIVIGYDVEAASNTASNQLNIGNLVFSNGIDGIGTTLSSGNLGIGTTTPINKLDVFGTGAGPSASGAASNGVLRIGATGLTRALDMGVSSGANVYSWIQSRSATSYGSNFSLALNPNGGNVGVGTSSPATSLHIDAANVGNGILTSQANFVITSNNAQAADRGGSLGFGGIYTSASDQRLFAGISGRKENSTGANQAGYLSFYTNNNSTLAEVMRINSSGNVGVGTTSPSSKLDVWGDFRVGTSTTPLLFADTTTGFVGVGTASPSYPLQVNGNVAGAFNAFALYNANGGLGSSAVLRFVNSSGGGATSTSNAQIAGIRTGNSPGTTALSFSTSDGTTVSEKMRIDSVGNVAIGTTSPAYRFEVYGHAGLNTPFVGLGGTSTDSGSTLYVYRYRNSSSTDSPLVDFIQSNASDDQVALRIKQDGTGNIISALSNNTEVFSLTATGNLGLGTTSPLAKLSVSGNTFIQGNLTATGTLTVSGTTSLAAASSSALSLTGYLYDSARSGGTLGMVLQSTGTSTRWVATSTLGISGSSFTNSAQLAALLSDETGTGFSVFGTSPAFAGIATFSGLTASSTLTLSGTAANIALGSNYLSGDGDDEGVYVGSTGNVGIGTTSPSSKLDVVGSVKASVSFISSLYTSATGSTISLHPGAAPTDISDGNMLSLVGGDAGSTLGVGGAVSITGGAGNANGYAGGLIDITGGTGNYNAPGGAVTIQGGEGIGGGGGALSLYGGDESNAGSGGTVNIKGGLSRGNGFDGGAVNISAGDASALVSDGGVLTLSGGSAVGNVGNGGDVVIAAGSGIGGGVSGDIVLMGGKVGIGTTTPWSALTVVGGISSPDRANVVANEAFGRDAFIVSGTGYANTVLGAYAGVNSSYSQENVVIGAYASSTKSYNVLIGANAYNDGDASVVIGANVTNTSGSSVLIGNSSGVSNDGLIALGFGNGAAAANSMAFGWGMYADEADSIVFGSRRTASTSPSFKLVGATDQYNAQDLFKIDTSWIDDTNVSRKGRTILSVFDTAERQFLQADATGSGVNVSFNGGNVGIGTTSPNAKLMVGNGTETGAQWIRNFGSVSDIWIGQSAFTHFGFAPGTAALMMQDSGRNFPLVVGNVNSKPLIFGTNNTERMRIHADGNVSISTTSEYADLTVGGNGVFTGTLGIGTVVPSQKLSIGDGTGTGAQWVRNFGSVSDIWIGQSAFTHFGFAPGTAALMMQDSGRNFPLVVGNANFQPLIFGTNNTERMRIHADGNVSISTTSEYADLTVGGNGVFTGTLGIGTVVPSQKLSIGDGTGTGAQWVRNFGSVSDIYIGQASGSIFGQNSSSTSYILQDGGRDSTLAIGNVNSKPLIFGTSNLERMRISADGSVGIGTTDTSNGTLVVNGGISGDTLYLPGTNTVTFTTPGNAPVPTKINIPFFDPGNFGQVMALGISSSSLNTSRVLSLFDDRRTAHQPTIGIFSPDENNLIGFSWEGSNSTSYLKTTSGNVAIRSSNYDIATFVESTGNVGIGTTTPGTKLAIAQSVDYSGLSIFGYDDMANTSADLSVGSGGEFAIGASTGGGFLAGVGGTYVASWNDNKLSVLDNVEFITGTDDDYSLGYHSASDTFRIVDGNDLASNVRLTMNSTGNIGIGTTSPSAKLDVWGSLVVGTSSTPLIWADVLDQVVMIGTSTNQVGVGGLTVAGDIFSDGFRTADAHSFGWGDFSSQIYGSSAGSDYISLYSGGQDRLWINGTTGNVGIGTTTPSYQLSIAGTSGELLQVANPGVTDARMLFQNSTSGFGTGNGIVLGINSSGAGTIWNYENRSIFFGTNDTERMRILSTGEVGIGTTTPSAQLTTTGTVRFANFGAGTLQTDASGNLSVSSDERLKDLQGMYTAGLNEILLIDPITYKWNEESGLETETTYAGFSAQNVLAALPEAVGESPNGFLTLSDRPILAAVVNAIKEIWEKVTGQQEKIDELEARIEALEAEQGIDAPAPEPEPEPDPAPQITPEPEPEVVVPPPEPTPEPEIVPESEPDPVPEPEVAP